jgi:hypothetical protein
MEIIEDNGGSSSGRGYWTVMIGSISDKDGRWWWVVIVHNEIYKHCHNNNQNGLLS